MTTQVVFNPLFLYTETLLIAKNVEVVSSYSLSASFSQQTSNTESTGKFRTVLKKKNVQFYSCRICMKSFGRWTKVFWGNWTRIKGNSADIRRHITDRTVISQQISKWAKKAAQGWCYDEKIILHDIDLTHEHESFGLASCTLTHSDSLLENLQGRFGGSAVFHWAVVCHLWTQRRTMCCSAMQGHLWNVYRMQYYWI